MRKIIVIIFIILATLIGFLLFNKSQQLEINNFSTITSAQLVTMLQQKDFLLFNVHVPYEGEIENTDAFIPFDKIADNLDKLPTDKNAKIVLYCRSGRMSEIAAKELIKFGFTQVSHLSGGMIDWKKNSYKIINDNGI